jgi:hypothetical protein
MVRRVVSLTSGRLDWLIIAGDVGFMVVASSCEKTGQHRRNDPLIYNPSIIVTEDLSTLTSNLKSLANLASC